MDIKTDLKGTSPSCATVREGIGMVSSQEINAAFLQQLLPLLPLRVQTEVQLSYVIQDAFQEAF